MISIFPASRLRRSAGGHYTLLTRPNGLTPVLIGRAREAISAECYLVIKLLSRDKLPTMEVGYV